MALLGYLIVALCVIFYSAVGLSYLYYRWILGMPFKDVDALLDKRFMGGE